MSVKYPFVADKNGETNRKTQDVNMPNLNDENVFLNVGYTPFTDTKAYEA